MSTGPIAREAVRSLGIYPVGEASLPGDEPVINLSANECAVSPSRSVLAALAERGPELNRYGDVSCGALREQLGRLHNIDANRIVCGNGSGDLICLLASAYCGDGDEVLMDRLGYLFFQTAARIAGATAIKVEHEGLAFDIDAALAAITDRTRVVFLDNPGNPTGALLGLDTVRRFREALPSDALLVLDAAYAEYVTDPDYDVGIELVEATDNTVMLRTFSKIYGLAGARLGWAYCPRDVAAVLNAVRLPDNVSSTAHAMGVAALYDQDRVRDLCAANTRIRGRFEESLRALGFEPFPSHGSFMLVRFPDPALGAAAADAYLKDRRIVARSMTPYGLADCLRFTIGAEREMQAVSAALRDFVSSS